MAWKNEAQSSVAEKCGRCDVRGCQARGRKPASATTKVDPAGPELPSTTRPGYRWGGRGTNEKNPRDASSGLRHNAELQSPALPFVEGGPPSSPMQAQLIPPQIQSSGQSPPSMGPGSVEVFAPPNVASAFCIANTTLLVYPRANHRRFRIRWKGVPRRWSDHPIRREIA